MDLRWRCRFRGYLPKGKHSWTSRETFTADLSQSKPVCTTVTTASCRWKVGVLQVRSTIAFLTVFATRRSACLREEPHSGPSRADWRSRLQTRLAARPVVAFCWSRTYINVACHFTRRSTNRNGRRRPWAGFPGTTLLAHHRTGNPGECAGGFRLLQAVRDEILPG